MVLLSPQFTGGGLRSVAFSGGEEQGSPLSTRQPSRGPVPLLSWQVIKNRFHRMFLPSHSLDTVSPTDLLLCFEVLSPELAKERVVELQVQQVSKWKIRTAGWHSGRLNGLGRAAEGLAQRGDVPG